MTEEGVACWTPTKPWELVQVQRNITSWKKWEPSKYAFGLNTKFTSFFILIILWKYFYRYIDPSENFSPPTSLCNCTQLPSLMLLTLCLPRLCSPSRVEVNAVILKKKKNKKMHAVEYFFYLIETEKNSRKLLHEFSRLTNFVRI